MNLILDNMLVIQYRQLQNEAETDIYNKLHTSRTGDGTEGISSRYG